MYWSWVLSTIALAGPYGLGTGGLPHHGRVFPPGFPVACGYCMQWHWCKTAYMVVVFGDYCLRVFSTDFMGEFCKHLLSCVGLVAQVRNAQLQKSAFSTLTLWRLSRIKWLHQILKLQLSLPWQSSNCAFPVNCKLASLVFLQLNVSAVSRV